MPRVKGLPAQFNPEIVEEKLNLAKEQNEYFNKHIDNIMAEVCTPMDRCIKKIMDRQSTGIDLSGAEIDYFCIELSGYIYTAGSRLERIGALEDSAKMIHAEIYNNAHMLSQGTKDDKKAIAEYESRNEQVAVIVTQRAYKCVKNRIEYATEMLQSLKKMNSRLMAELHVTRMVK